MSGLECVSCSATLRSKRQRYCSNACRQKAYRARNDVTATVNEDYGRCIEPLRLYTPALQVVSEWEPFDLVRGPTVALLPATLREIRCRAGLSQLQLSMLTGVSRVTICALECDRQHPTMATVYKLADALAVCPSELVGTEPEVRPRRTRSRLPVRQHVTVTVPVPAQSPSATAAWWDDAGYLY